MRWKSRTDLPPALAAAYARARRPLMLVAALSLVQDCPLRLTGKRQNHPLSGSGRKVSLYPGNSYWLLDVRPLDISSTEIREIV